MEKKAAYTIEKGNKGDEEVRKWKRQVDERRDRGRRAWYERSGKEGVRQKSR